MIPIFRAAGAFKRIDPEGSEEAILYRTMQDLIMPKLVYLDIPLFRALLGDLFPGVDQPRGRGRRPARHARAQVRRARPAGCG